MLLLFWRDSTLLGAGTISAGALGTGVGTISLQSGQGIANAIAVASGSGVQIFQGVGLVTAQAVLSGTGVQSFSGVGLVTAQAVLSGTGQISLRVGQGAALAQGLLLGTGLFLPELTSVGQIQAQAGLVGTGLFLPRLDNVGQIQAHASLLGLGSVFLRADIGQALAQALLLGVGGEVLSEVDYLWTISGSGGVQYQEGYQTDRSVQYHVRDTSGSGEDTYLQRQQTRRAQYQTDPNEPGTEYLIRRRGR